MVNENKALVCRMVEVIQNGHQLERMEEFFDPNFVNHLEAADSSSEYNSVARAKQVFSHLFKAFPDLHVVIQDQVAEGDKVVTHKIFYGTQQSEFMGMAADGKKIEFAVMDILRIDNGRIVEHWALQDRMSLMLQLGVVAMPG